MRVLAWPGFNTGELNPYTRLLYGHMESSQVQIEDFSTWRALWKGYDILHLHWPEYYVAHRNPLKAVFGTAGLLLCVFWCRMRGARVIWTVHNLGSHNRPRPRMEKWFWQVFTNSLDGYICLTESGRKQAQQVFPALHRLPAFVIPHGHYRGEYPNGISPVEARERLGLPANTRLLLFFGTVARYKNVPGLIRAFRQLPDPGKMLLIAGACAPNEDPEVFRREAGADSRIKLHLGFIPRENVQLYFQAADLVVLPFREILNSGSALLSLSFNRPILVPGKGAMSDLQTQFGPHWVRTYSDELTRSELLQALEWATDMDKERPKEVLFDRLDWPALASETLRLYATVRAERA